MSDYRNRLDTGVNNIGYTIVRLAPIIAPIPALATLLDATSYAVYAWFVVLGVELTGYAIGEQSVKAIRLQVFKLRHLIWALVVYGIVIEGLMLGYKVLPAWAEWYAGRIDLSHAIQAVVGILYPAFTLAGAILFAFHEYLEEVQADQEHEKLTKRESESTDKEDDREFERQRRQIELDAMRRKTEQDADIEREKALSAIRIKESKSVQNSVQKEEKASAVKRPKKEITMNRMIDIYRENPHVGHREIARMVNVSKSTITNYLDELGQRKIVHVNGNGVEIIGDL